MFAVPADLHWRHLGALLLAVAIVAPGIESHSVAAAYGDPVARVHAEDESTYANSAVAVAAAGGWLTPRVMDRFLLFKPPLLVWTAALSLKTFGIHLWSLRLPALAAACIAAAVLFHMAEGRGLIALLLVLTSSLWHIFAKLCYTDMLLALAIIAAMCAIDQDPALTRRGSFLLFVVACAAGIMTKNVAGGLPLFVASASAIVLPRDRRPGWTRLAQVALATAALTAPWHLYQWLAHRQWFIADYIGLQLFAFGIAPPAQYASEPAWMFYAVRLVRLEPLLLAAAIMAAPGFLSALRVRDSRAMLAAIWLGSSAAALLAFQYRNAPYLLQVVPPLALIAARYGPWTTVPRRRTAIAVIAAAFAIHLATGHHPLAVQLATHAQPEPWTAMKRYAALGRGRELIVVSPDEAFFSSTLGLPKVRYMLLDPRGLAARYAPHYAELGILLTAPQALALPSLTPGFQQKLRAWGLDSAAPIGTTITPRTSKELIDVLRTFPASDFYLPEYLWREAGLESTHESAAAFPERVFALARSPRPEGLPAPAARPSRW